MYNKKINTLILTLGIVMVCNSMVTFQQNNYSKKDYVKKNELKENSPKKIINKNVLSDDSKIIKVNTANNVSTNTSNTTNTSTDIFYNAAKNNMLPEAYLKAIAKIESNLDNNCYEKSTHATGIMQLTPQTATELGVKDIYNANETINAAAGYLKSLVDKYRQIDCYDQNHNPLTPYEMAAIAYNWGPNNLDRHIKRNGCVVIAKNSKYGIPEETYNYVLKLRSLYDVNEYYDN